MATFNYLITFRLYSLVLLLSCFSEHIKALGCPSPDYNRYNATYLNLTSLRDLLVRQEDTIVSCLIERSKYPLNKPLYAKSLKGQSLFDSFIKDSEAVQAKAGRYLTETENKFSSDYSQLPTPNCLNCPRVLYYAGACININAQILDYYVSQLIPLVAAKDPADDSCNYVPAASTDLTCLQALSGRIHTGKFVAETKFNQATKNYTALIRAKDETGLRELLTDKKIEDAIVARVGRKAQIFGQDVNGTSKQYKVEPSVVSGLYENMVIPRTKDVEVEYLLRRLSTSKCRA